MSLNLSHQCPEAMDNYCTYTHTVDSKLCNFKNAHISGLFAQTGPVKIDYYMCENSFDMTVNCV